MSKDQRMSEPRVDRLAEDRCERLHPKRHRPGFPCHECEKAAGMLAATLGTEPGDAFAAIIAGLSETEPPSALDYADADQIARTVTVNGEHWAILVRRAS